MRSGSCCLLDFELMQITYYASRKGNSQVWYERTPNVRMCMLGLDGAHTPVTSFFSADDRCGVLANACLLANPTETARVYNPWLELFCRKPHDLFQKSEGDGMLTSDN